MFLVAEMSSTYLFRSLFMRSPSVSEDSQSQGPFPLHEAVKRGDEDNVLVLIKTLGPTSVNSRDNVCILL